MKHIFLTAIASVVALTSVDASDIRFESGTLLQDQPVKNTRFLRNSKNGTEPAYKAFHTKLSSGLRTEASEQTHTLSITLEADQEKFDPIWTQIIGKDGFLAGVWHDLTVPEFVTASTELPEGEYCIVSHLREIDPTMMFKVGPDVLLVTKVDLTEDLSVTLDASSAVNILSGTFYIPGGEVAKLPATYYPIDGEMQELDGNVNFLQINSTLSNIDFGFLYGIVLESDFEALGEDPEYKAFDMTKRSVIKINSLGDDFCFSQFRLASTDADGFYYSDMKPLWGISSESDLHYSKDYDLSYVVDGVRSISGEESFKAGYTPTYDCKVSSIQPNHFITRGVRLSTSPKLWLAGACQNTEPVEHLFSVSYSDFQTTVYDDEEPEIELGTMVYFTSTMPVRFNTDGMTETVFTPIIGNYSQIADKNEHCFITSRALSFADADCRQRLGDSQPTISFLSYEEFDWEVEENVWKMSALPIGRLGEFRAGDTAVTDWNKKEETVDGAKLTTMGVSVSNQMVDGIRGVTTASFTVDPEKTIAPPVLRQLQFRNSEGIVTDRFDSPSDGRFLISTATYTQESYPEGSRNWWYNVSQCISKVSVSPYGEQKWIEVELEELPEDYVAAFGNLYTGSLASVEDKSANGWYDMKVELTSVDGAVSSQIISPAFKIRQSSGVTAVSNDGLRIVVDRSHVYVPGEPDAELTAYTMDGRTVASGIGVLKLASLPKGIYLVKAGEYSVKIAI